MEGTFFCPFKLIPFALDSVLNRREGPFKTICCNVSRERTMLRMLLRITHGCCEYIILLLDKKNQFYLNYKKKLIFNIYLLNNTQ